MSSNREFVRIQAEVGLAYQKIAGDEWPRWESGSLLVSRRQAAIPPPDGDYTLGRLLSETFEPEVARFLEGLDQKVSTLLELASERDDRHDLPRTPVEISACGISFPCAGLGVGDRILLTVALPGRPQRIVEVIASVVRIVDTPPDRWVAATFDQITNHDRERLVRFALQLQRELAKLHGACSDCG
ncbi:MAG: hypothetical protein AUK30_09360 [Nitrospirae bacterium CG2_30_70_394]|nr:PilZ domain-containing protein [Deltaproteobacteria bacterium]OIP62891.1 MAG: hypothetical protein AUK30_09360 [Nitrospirae bacterium CG2_30_70_394]